MQEPEVVSVDAGVPVNVAESETSPFLRMLRLLGLATAVVAVVVAVKVFTESASASAVSIPGRTNASSVYKFTAGSPAPNFSLTALDGRTMSLADFRGRQVMVNFWATWCPPCRSEMPDMEQVYQERKADGLVILAINIQEANAPIQQFVNKYGLSFPVLLDVSGEVSQQFAVQSLPTSFFIDREGRIASFSIGALNKSAIIKRLSLNQE